MGQSQAGFTYATLNTSPSVENIFVFVFHFTFLQITEIRSFRLWRARVYAHRVNFSSRDMCGACSSAAHLTITQLTRHSQQHLNTYTPTHHCLINTHTYMRPPTRINIMIGVIRYQLFTYLMSCVTSLSSFASIKSDCVQ